MKIGDFYYGTNVGARSPKALNVFEVFSDFVTFFYQKRCVRETERAVSLNEQDMAKVKSKRPQNAVA